MTAVRLLGVATRALVEASAVRLLGVGTNAGAAYVSITSPVPGTVVYPGDRVDVVVETTGASVTWTASGPLRIVTSDVTGAVVEVIAAMPSAGDPVTGRIVGTLTATLPGGESSSLVLSVVPQVVWAWSPSTESWVGGGPEPLVPTP